MREFTHKGWFGVCPVYLYDTYTDTPTLQPRIWPLWPLLWFSLGMQRLANLCWSLINPEHEFSWCLRITGKKV